MNPILLLAKADLVVVVRRWWYSGIIGVGILGILFALTRAWGEEGRVQADTFRADVASVYLLAGISLALALGATAFWGAIHSGNLGLLAASGARRAHIALGRVTSRIVALLIAIGIWIAASQIASLALGRGLDRPLIVHGLAMLVTLLFTMLVACAVSTVFGPIVAGAAGLSSYVLVQAVVNLEAAADLGRLGSATSGVHIAYNILPRAVHSPMLVDMHNRGNGGPAAPQFEIDNIPVPLFPAAWTTVAWTLLWCALTVWLCIRGTRRRTFN